MARSRPEDKIVLIHLVPACEVNGCGLICVIECYVLLIVVRMIGIESNQDLGE